MLLQCLRVDGCQAGQRVHRGDEQGDFRALRHRRAGQVGRIHVLGFDQGNLRPATLNQRDQVLAFGDQPFQLQVRVALFEGLEGEFEAFRLVRIGHRDTQLWLQPLGQLACRQLQTAAGLQHLLGALQQHMPRRGQRRLAAAAIKQHHVQVDLKAGHCRADGGLALAQLARRRRKRALGGSLHKRLEHFMGRHDYRLDRWLLVMKYRLKG